MMKISRHPISLDRPVGESEDSYFGDFIEDETAETPGQRRHAGDAQGQDRPGAQDADLPRARDHQAPLRPGRRLHLHARRSRPHLQGDPRARPPDRGQGRPQAAAPGAEPAARGLPRHLHSPNEPDGPAAADRAAEREAPTVPQAPGDRLRALPAPERDRGGREEEGGAEEEARSGAHGPAERGSREADQGAPPRGRPAQAEDGGGEAPEAREADADALVWQANTRRWSTRSRARRRTSP